MDWSRSTTAQILQQNGSISMHPAEKLTPYYLPFFSTPAKVIMPSAHLHKEKNTFRLSLDTVMDFYLDIKIKIWI